MRIAQVAPVATTIPPPRSGSVEQITADLCNGLVDRGHDVTLFATGDSNTRARLHAEFPHGYWHDNRMWPWELYEMLNLAAAVERAGQFDVIHYQAAYYPMALPFARLSTTPIVHTVHHLPSEDEVRLWWRYPHASFVAVSRAQAERMRGVNVVATVLHGLDLARFTFRAQPEGYLLFLGRFTEGKGVLTAIDVARRAGMRLLLAGADDDYYRAQVARHVDGTHVVYAGEADFDAKVSLYGGASALLYPLQSPEPFGLVLPEAMACGTPVAALACGAVREVVDDGVTGQVFDSADALLRGLPSVIALDRARVRARALERFGVERMAREYEAVYARVAAAAASRRS